MLDKAIVVLLSLVLFVSLAGANVALGLDRGPLEPEVVKDATADAGLAETLREEVILAEFDDDIETDLPIDVDAVVEAALSDEAVQAVTDDLIEEVWAVLRGGEVSVTVDLTEPRAAAAQAIADEVATLDPAALGIDEVAPLLESEEAYLAERAAFEAAVKAEIQAESDPYEMSEEELELAYQALLPQIREEMREEFQATLDEEGVPEELHDELLVLGEVVIEAFTTDLGFEPFLDAYRDAMYDVGLAASELVFEEADVPAQIDLTEELDDEAVGAIEQVQWAVSVIETLALLLPLVALGAVAGLAWTTAVPSTALLASGSIATVVGALSYGAARAIPPRLATVAGDAGELGAVALQVVAATLGPFATQSVVLTAGGAGLLGLGVAMRRGLLLREIEAWRQPEPTPQAFDDDGEAAGGPREL